MRKVLWLASWYPNSTDQYTGDFIERHARSTTGETKIHVLHVVKNNSLPAEVKKKLEIRLYTNDAEACIIYYRPTFTRFPLLEKLHSGFLYLYHHIQFLRNYIKEHGKPDGIHVHVAMKSGIAALCFKYFYRIPYVVTEHWSGLCADAKPNFSEKPFLFRWLWQQVVKKAAGNTAVSEWLAISLQNRFSLKKMKVIPNVVDGEMFFPSAAADTNNQFIHISGLNFQKNPQQLLEAMAVLNTRVPGIKLLIFGEPDEALRRLSEKSGLGKVIEFRGLQPQTVLREEIQRSMALILYSRFETFGCVIIEANACGKPVIVSDIPVFHENVTDGITGLFVPLNNPILLAEAMYEIVTKKHSFDPEKIRIWATDRYSFEKAGREFEILYDEAFG